MMKIKSVKIISQKIVNIIENYETQLTNQKEDGIYHLLILFY